MSMFDNIVFDEFTLLEGEQAEAYKKRKAKEAAAQNKKEMNRAYRYANDRIANHGDEYYKKAENDAADKMFKSSPKTKKEFEDADTDWSPEGEKKEVKVGKKMMYGMDAMDRHNRRHGKKQKVAESMIASYESEFAY